MGPNRTILILIFCIFAVVSESLGLRCYTCTLGDKDRKPCEEFYKLNNETEKMSRFGTVCDASATGCAFTKANSGDGLIKLETEALSCYSPEAKWEKVVVMNECVEVGEASQKICVCNSGDYCLQGGSGGLRGGGVVVAILAALAQFIRH